MARSSTVSQLSRTAARRLCVGWRSRFIAWGAGCKMEMIHSSRRRMLVGSIDGFRRLSPFLHQANLFVHSRLRIRSREEPFYQAQRHTHKGQVTRTTHSLLCCVPAPSSDQHNHSIIHINGERATRNKGATPTTTEQESTSFIPNTPAAGSGGWRVLCFRSCRVAAHSIPRLLPVVGALLAVEGVVNGLRLVPR